MILLPDLPVKSDPARGPGSFPPYLSLQPQNLRSNPAISSGLPRAIIRSPGSRLASGEGLYIIEPVDFFIQCLGLGWIFRGARLCRFSIL